MVMSNFFRFRVTLLTLFGTIFLDALGTALIVPLLNPLFFLPGGILLETTPIEIRNFLYGLSLGIFAFSMFLGAPLLGQLSDKVGRKRILLICLLGTFAGYFFCALAIFIRSISLFILGRIIGGFTAGSLVIAQAAIIDVSSDQNKTANLGLILFAVSLGYISGPIIGGGLSDAHWLSWFNLTTPLYFTSIISLINIVLMQVFFTETFKPNQHKKINLLASFNSFATAFKIKNIRSLSAAFFLMQLGWATYFQFVALFLNKQYALNQNSIGIFMALIGVGLTIAFCFAIRFLAQYFTLNKLIQYSISIMVVNVLTLLLPQTTFLAWIAAVPGAIAFGVAYSAFISLFSAQVNTQSQGMIMGIAAAICAFCAGFAGIFAGIIAKYGTSMPLWFACAALAASGVLFAVICKRKMSDALEYTVQTMEENS